MLTTDDLGFRHFCRSASTNAVVITDVSPHNVSNPSQHPLRPGVTLSISDSGQAHSFWQKACPPMNRRTRVSINDRRDIHRRYPTEINVELVLLMRVSIRSAASVSGVTCDGAQSVHLCIERGSGISIHRRTASLSTRLPLSPCPSGDGEDVSQTPISPRCRRMSVGTSPTVRVKRPTWDAT